MDVLLNSAYKQGAHTPSSLNIVLGLWFDKTHLLQKKTFFFGSINRNPLKIGGILLLDFFTILLAYIFDCIILINIFIVGICDYFFLNIFYPFF